MLFSYTILIKGSPLAWYNFGHQIPTILPVYFKGGIILSECAIDSDVRQKSYRNLKIALKLEQYYHTRIKQNLVFYKVKFYKSNIELDIVTFLYKIFNFYFI